MLGILVSALLVSIYACGVAVRWVGGASKKKPAEIRTGLSTEARRLVEAAFEGIERERLFDYHTHLVGLGAGGSGAFVNPRMRTWKHPVDRVKFAVYLSASGVEDQESADLEYAARLLDLIRGIDLSGRHLLLAFDQHYRPDGTPSTEDTEFYTPNAYAEATAKAHPEHFEFAMSVHPYRPDALAELEKWAQRGARVVKWLPNAMGINPGDERLVPYYEKMKALDLVLLTHAGEEKAVHAEAAQKLGNPLLLRRPLDLGVKVIVAHCASLGQNADLDDPQAPLRDNFDLFVRMMDDPKYEGLLFGEISAVVQTNRLWKPLTTLLERTDLHPRMVNGSDYPLPAINVLIRTDQFSRAGFISREEKRALKEIYDYNPLLFDFVLKRTLRHPKTKAGFAPSIFMEHPALSPKA